MRLGTSRGRIGSKPGRALVGAALSLIWLGAASGPAAAGEQVRVLYAGSLVTLMEQGIGPAFDTMSGDRFEGYAGGSNKLAHEIKARLRPADVFISANPKVNRMLMGRKTGAWLSWYIDFAQSPLVIGYNAHSKFASDFKTKPWLTVLEEPGLRLGRTDPKLDPKGRLTLELMQHAASAAHQPGLATRILGAPENPSQVLPEEELVGRLQSGQIDAGFFYSTETRAAHIPAIQLPPAIAPHARYTVSILNSAPHEAAARAFVMFLLSSRGQKILKAYGLATTAPALTGAAATLPPGLRHALAGTR